MMLLGNNSYQEAAAATILTPTVRTSPTPTTNYRYSKTIRIQNRTGQTANGLEVYVQGRSYVNFIWSNGVFLEVSNTYNSSTNTTTYRFFNGTVEPDGWVYAGLHCTSPLKEVKQRTWVYDGVPLGMAGASLSAAYFRDENGITNITLGNYAPDGGPITITDFQYGSGGPKPLSELTWSNEVLNTQINWSAPQTLHLDLNETKTFAVSQGNVIYRAKAYRDSDPDNIVEFYDTYDVRLLPSPTPVRTVTTTPTPTPTRTITPTPTTGGGFVVTYVIQSDWGNGATVSVTIKNINTFAVSGWTLAWTFHGNQTITNLWNGTYTQSGATVSVRDNGFNAWLGANGGSVNFGFNLSYSGTIAKPTSFTLNGTPCIVQ